nr:DUF6468 domain-containing protein [Rhodovibrio salinarum]
MDVLVAGLLAATIFYAVMLNRKLGELRNNKAEMEAMVNRLVQTTERAEHGLAELKAAAHEKGEELSQKLNDAKALNDDLGFLVDKGNSLADRMERQIGAARKVTADPRGVEPMGLHEAAQRSTAAAKGAATKANGTGTTLSSAPAVGSSAANEGGKPDTAGTDTTLRAAPRGAARSTPQNAKLLKALRGVR